jgi:hypothetical protein
VPWAFGPAPLATVARLCYPLCGQGPLNANTDTSAQAARLCPSKTAEVHYRPSTVGRPKQCDLGHMVACTGQGELVSNLVRMMDGMGRSKRPSSPRVKQAQPDRQPSAEPPSPAQQVSRMSPSQVLETDQARPNCTPGGRGGARGPNRLRRRPRHRLARDRRLARRNQTCCPPALPAPPP